MLILILSPHTPDNPLSLGLLCRVTSHRLAVAVQNQFVASGKEHNRSNAQEILWCLTDIPLKQFIPSPWGKRLKFKDGEIVLIDKIASEAGGPDEFPFLGFGPPVVE